MPQEDKQIAAVPGGRLSYIRHPDGTIHIQTEFSTFPEMRIVTTVVLNGAVLLKQAENWAAPIASEEEYRKAEEFLNKQHDQVIGRTRELMENADPMRIKTDIAGRTETTPPRSEGADLKLVLDMVGRLDNIRLLAVMDLEGVVLHSSREMAESPVVRSAEAFTGLVRIFSERFNCGEFIDAVYRLSENGIGWISAKDFILAIECDRPEPIIKRLKELADAD
jgi:hypothetical protein